MKVFISYPHTGENEVEVRSRMKKVVAAVRQAGHEPYCNLFDEDQKHFSEPKEFIKDALKKLRTSDLVLVLQPSERRSEGVLIEVGAALTVGIPIIVARHSRSVGTSYIWTLANKSFEWSTEEQLTHAITDLLVDK